MNWQNLNWVDYTIISVLGLSTLISLIRGFVREALSLVIWIGALWLAYRYASYVATHFLGSIQNQSLRLPLAFVALFFAILIIGAILSFIINSLVHGTGLSGTDRVLGIVFGLARGVLLVGVLVLAGHMSAVTQTDWWEKSELLPQFEGLAEWLHSMLPEKFGQLSTMPSHSEDNAPKVETPTSPTTPPAVTPDAATPSAAPTPVAPPTPITTPEAPAQQSIPTTPARP